MRLKSDSQKRINNKYSILVNMMAYFIASKIIISEKFEIRKCIQNEKV